jgi:hypothetical protein
MARFDANIIGFSGVRGGRQKYEPHLEKKKKTKKEKKRPGKRQ